MYVLLTSFNNFVSFCNFPFSRQQAQTSSPSNPLNKKKLFLKRFKYHQLDRYFKRSMLLNEALGNFFKNQLVITENVWLWQSKIGGAGRMSSKHGIRLKGLNDAPYSYHHTYDTRSIAADVLAYSYFCYYESANVYTFPDLLMFSFVNRTYFIALRMKDYSRSSSTIRLIIIWYFHFCMLIYELPDILYYVHKTLSRCIFLRQNCLH